jgi:hypothetical protein
VPGGLMGTGNRGGLMGLDDVGDSSVSTADIANLAVTTGKLANNAVTYAKIQTVAARSVLGNATASTAACAEITASADNTFLARSGGTLAFIALTTALTVGYTPTATRIAYGCGGGGCLTDSADFTWDNSTKTVRLTGTTPILDLEGSIWRFRIKETSSGSGIINLESSTNDRWVQVVTAGSGVINLCPGGTQRLRLDTSPAATWDEGVNHVYGTATGTKHGTAANQKQAWWGAAAVVQGAAVADAAGGVTVDDEARAAINTLLARVRTYGLIAT